MPNNHQDASENQHSWLRPQSVVFTLLAEHVLARDVAVFSGSFIEILGRLGIGEHTTRSTLARMARRGLLARERVGRKVFFRMTPRCHAILEDGHERIWSTGAVNASQAQHWTLLTFSLPEAWQKQRYDLRARLTWAGFGPLQNGVWLAPREVDVSAIVDQLALQAHVRVFQAALVAPADAHVVIRDTFDLESLAEGYRSFIASWDHVTSQRVDDPLGLTLRLSTHWLRVIRHDPRVPIELLPPSWPAVEAQRIFRSLHGAHRAAAERQARQLLEVAAGDSRPSGDEPPRGARRS